MTKNSSEIALPSFAATALRIIGVLGALLLFSFFFFVFIGSRFVDNRARETAARVRADLRSLATAIEAYRLDRQTSPAWSATPGENDFSAERPADRAILENLPTFLRYIPGGPATLTSPVAYLSAFESDPCSPVTSQTYCYWSDESMYILWSPGPDRKYDLTLKNIAQACDPAVPAPNPTLTDLTYDPSNGSVSPGDIWRISD